MTTYETTPLGAAAPPEVSTHEKLRSHEIWAAPLMAVAATGAFALVVNLVRFGFARDWLDPAGYVFALLKPLVLTFPGYLVLRVVIGRCDLAEEVALAARALRRASLSIACYAPVIWFYLITSPTATTTFPTIALSFGAIAFWTPLIFDLLRRTGRPSAAEDRTSESGRRIGSRGGAVLSIFWIALMLFAEARTMLAWLAEGIVGRYT